MAPWEWFSTHGVGVWTELLISPVIVLIGFIVFAACTVVIDRLRYASPVILLVGLMGFVACAVIIDRLRIEIVPRLDAAEAWCGRKLGRSRKEAVSAHDSADKVPAEIAELRTDMVRWATLEIHLAAIRHKGWDGMGPRGPGGSYGG
jgi:hypothetical protein